MPIGHGGPTLWDGSRPTAGGGENLYSDANPTRFHSVGSPVAARAAPPASPSGINIWGLAVSTHGKFHGSLASILDD